MNAQFEQYAREHLSGHEVRVDTDALWAEVYPQIKPEKGNRKILWFFLAGLFIGLAGFGVFYFNKNTNTTEITAPDSLKATNDIKPAVSPNPIGEKETMATAAIVETEANQENTTTDVITSTTTKEATIINLNHPNAKTANGQSKGIKSVTDNPTYSAVKTTDAKAKSIEESGATTNDLPAGNPAKDVDNSSVLKRNFKSASRLPLLFPKTLEVNSLRDVDITPFTPKLKPMLAGDILAKKDNKKKKSTPDIFRDMKFGIGLYSGISQSNSDLEIKNESATDFLLARTVAEKQLETIHFGLNAMVQTEKNLYLRTGVEYTRVASLFSRNATIETMDTTQGIVEYVISALTGDTIDVIEGDVIVTRTTSYNKKSYNYFHLVDVPVILGFNFTDSENPWVLGVEAGIYANVFIKNKGDIPLDDGSFYDIGDDPQKWYKTNIGISPFVGINAAYNISYNLQIHLSPSFRFNSVYSTDANPLTEKHGNLGVLGGVRYFFD